jgi:hypothetical protein
LGASPVSAPAVASAPVPAPEPIPAEETGFEKVPPAAVEPAIEVKRPGRPKGAKKVEVVATVPVPAPTVAVIEPGKSAETADAMVASGDDADEEMRLEQALKRACEMRNFRRAEILARTLVSLAEIG